jgi:hypothetical protein
VRSNRPFNLEGSVCDRGICAENARTAALQGFLYSLVLLLLLLLVSLLVLLILLLPP